MPIELATKLAIEIAVVVTVIVLTVIVRIVIVLTARTVTETAIDHAVVMSLLRVHPLILQEGIQTPKLYVSFCSYLPPAYS